MATSLIVGEPELVADKLIQIMQTHVNARLLVYPGGIVFTSDSDLTQQDKDAIVSSTKQKIVLNSATIQDVKV